MTTQQQTAQHTPGRIVVNVVGNGRKLLYPADGHREIAECETPQLAIAMAHRWNAHDDLLAVLERIAAVPCNCPPDALPGDDCESCIARAAIAKARGT